jgi:hypothetical protein
MVFIRFVTAHPHPLPVFKKQAASHSYHCNWQIFQFLQHSGLLHIVTVIQDFIETAAVSLKYLR